MRGQQARGRGDDVTGFTIDFRFRGNPAGAGFYLPWQRCQGPAVTARPSAKSKNRALISNALRQFPALRLQLSCRNYYLEKAQAATLS
jgi:hypothetical protein